MSTLMVTSCDGCGVTLPGESYTHGWLTVEQFGVRGPDKVHACSWVCLVAAVTRRAETHGEAA